MKVKNTFIEIKNIKKYIYSDFFYTNKKDNFNKINKILNNIQFENIEKHIFLDLITSNGSCLSVVKIIKKYYKNYKKKFNNLDEIFFHKNNASIKEKVLKLLNDKKILDTIHKSIKINGFIVNKNSPLVIINHKNQNYLLDGFHRFFICKHLNFKKINVEVYYV